MNTPNAWTTFDGAPTTTILPAGTIIDGCWVLPVDTEVEIITEESGGDVNNTCVTEGAYVMAGGVVVKAKYISKFPDEWYED